MLAASRNTAEGGFSTYIQSGCVYVKCISTRSNNGVFSDLLTGGFVILNEVTKIYCSQYVVISPCSVCRLGRQ